MFLNYKYQFNHVIMSHHGDLVAITKSKPDEKMVGPKLFLVHKSQLTAVDHAINSPIQNSICLVGVKSNVPHPPLIQTIHDVLLCGELVMYVAAFET